MHITYKLLNYYMVHTRSFGRITIWPRYQTAATSFCRSTTYPLRHFTAKAFFRQPFDRVRLTLYLNLTLIKFSPTEVRLVFWQTGRQIRHGMSQWKNRLRCILGTPIEHACEYKSLSALCNVYAFFTAGVKSKGAQRCEVKLNEAIFVCVFSIFFWNVRTQVDFRVTIMYMSERI